MSATNPPPKPGRGDVWLHIVEMLRPKGVPEDLIADMLARREKGIQTYGVPLQFGNGRDYALDAYEEALDCFAYAVAAENVPEAIEEATADLLAQVYLWRKARRAAEALPDDPEDQDTPAPLVEPPVLADALRFQPVLNDGTGASAQRAVDALVRAGWPGSYVNDGSAWVLRTIGDALPRRVPVGSRVSMRVDGRLWVVP